MRASAPEVRKLWEARAKELQRKRGKREGRSQPTGPTLTHACPKRAAHLHQWTSCFEVIRTIPLPKREHCSKLLTSAGKKDREGTTSSRAAKPQENGTGLSAAIKHTHPPPTTLVIPNRAKGPVRARPERSRRKPARIPTRARPGRARLPVVPQSLRKTEGMLPPRKINLTVHPGFENRIAWLTRVTSNPPRDLAAATAGDATPAIPALVFTLLLILPAQAGVGTGAREILRERILNGNQTSLRPTAPENARTVDASWIKEAVTRHVPIELHNAVIQGRLELQDSTIDQEFDMSGCTVRDYADFSHVTFKRNFLASDVAFLAGVSFQSAGFEHGAILQRAHFNGGPIIFEDAHFFAGFSAEAAEFGSKGGGTAVFSHARFDSTADFAMSVFNTAAHFIGAQFLGQGYFPGVRFEGSADFTRAHFLNWTTFGAGSPANFNSTFEGQTFFIETQFDSSTWFNGVTFGSDVAFDSARFGSRAEFRGTAFGSAVAFDRSHFDSDAYFQEALFRGRASFRSTTFQTVYFSGKASSGTAQFGNDVDMLGCTYDRIQINWRSLLQYPNGQSRIHPYERQPYDELEEVLRKSGFEGDANSVYRERRRVENEKGWRKFWDRLYWLFADYGIDLWHELGWTLISLAFGTLIFSRPGAVATGEGGHRTETTIPWRSALSLAWHQFLPISLPVKPRYTPSTRVLRWRGWPLPKAAVYANFLQIVGWILIPLAAAVLTGLLRHDGR